MNTLTDEQLAEIADKGAEAARETGKCYCETLVLSQKRYNKYWEAEQPARVAFARTVIALALEEMGKGEEDLVSKGFSGCWALSGENLKLINDSYRDHMAALRAQMQGEIDEQKAGWDKCTELLGLSAEDRDQWKERAEAAEKELAALKQQSQSNRVEYCYICGVPTDDWVDPSWSKGRVCRDCESKHEPVTSPSRLPPLPPEGFHIATEEELSFLPERTQAYDKVTGKLHSENFTGQATRQDRRLFHIFCPNTPPIVSFTNGKLNPPPYGSWHRSDWSPEMLPDGWRPLLLGEEENWDADQFLGPCGGKWIKGPTGGGATEDDYHRRTKRPLPPAPEKEKEKEPEPATLHGWTKAPPLTLQGEVRMRVEWLADYLSVQRTDYERKHALNSTLVGLEGVLAESSKPKLP